MKFTIVAAITALLTLPAIADNVTMYSTPMTDKYSQKELMKNWALSDCFYAIAKDSKTKQDASETASAYAEFGHSQIQTYHELQKLVDTQARGLSHAAIQAISRLRFSSKRQERPFANHGENAHATREFTRQPDL